MEVTWLPPDADGLIAPASLAAALRPNTRLVSILYANNETGVLQPIAELARLSKAHGALFHTDAVQAAGKLPLHLTAGLTADLTAELKDVDLLSLSGHKLYAPQGTGALFVRRKLTLAPMFHGGPHERQRRAGTENVAGIVALGQAAEAASAWLAGAGPHDLRNLRDQLEQTLCTHVPGLQINGDRAPRIANTSNLRFPGIEAESLLIALDLQGIAVSAGSACQSGASEPSHVLTAMGLTDAEARASIRISLSRLTTAEEITRASDVIAQTAARLRSLQPTPATR